MTTKKSARTRRVSTTRITRLARDLFGFDTFRPGQLEAIQSVITGRDTLAVLPTGAGKSAVYQLATVIRKGVTVVVSPLIALQQDQVDSIGERRIGRAVALNSSLDRAEREAMLADIRSGEVRFVFLSPEQLANEAAVDLLAALEPTLFVVDEAHCISEWGHDFRPDYLRLGVVVERLGHPTVCALTATAAPPVRREIVERLGLRDPEVIVSGFDRPNIRLLVERVDGPAARRESLLARVEALPKPGIVYAATRRDTEAIAADLAERGVDAVAYHAGLKGAERTRIQDAFMAGDHEVIVATIAFGMGIDKADVRFVIHASISESLDAYYQEIGRAGRDGEPATALLYYDPRDLDLRRFQGGAGVLPEEEVLDVLKSLHHDRGPSDPAEVREHVELTDSRLMRVVNRLEEVGAVEVLPDGAIRTAHRKGLIADDAHDAVVAQGQHQQFARSRLEMMRRYADARGCRRADLITYFGERFDAPCGNCDNCLAGRGVAEDDPAGRPFPLSASVRHGTWGAGTVLRYEGDTVIVLFDDVGYRSLLVEVVEEEGLLTLEAS